MQRLSTDHDPEPPGGQTFPLFAGQGINLSIERKARLSRIEWPSCYIFVIYRQYAALNSKGDSNCQLSFCFMKPVRPNVIRFIPKCSYPYLDYGIYELFRNTQNAAPAALRLQKRGLRYVGHLVQFTESDLRALPFMTDLAITEISDGLKECGLALGSAVPLWNAGYWENRNFRPSLG